MAAWSLDSRRLWVCQVEDPVGAHLLEVDLSGAIAERAFYANTGFASAFAPCVSESPGGHYAIGLGNHRVIITDGEYRETGVAVGQAQGWRPRPQESRPMR